MFTYRHGTFGIDTPFAWTDVSPGPVYRVCPALMRCATKSVASLHHGSHLKLLVRPESAPGPRAGVDAIIVPASRPAERLQNAIDLSVQLGCYLMALCSHDASASRVVGLARRCGADALAIEMPTMLQPVPFRTTQMLVATPFDHRTDIGAKRNIGLLMAGALGWRRIVFLDDDIVVKADHLVAAAALLDRFHAVGLTDVGYPDNSVVCHAYRLTGGRQESFVGAGALAVAPLAIEAFFPRVYNEDWLFLLNGVQRRLVATMGTVEQEEYNPFARARRARAEEFGDCLAEGLYWLLDEGGTTDDADLGYWSGFLHRRRALVTFIADRVARVRRNGPDEARMAVSLRVAYRTLVTLRPQLFVDYLAAWRQDQETWLAARERFAAFESADKVVAELGVTALRSRDQVVPRQLTREPALRRSAR